MATPRNQPLTVAALRRELHAALKAYHETAARDLNDRFTHWDKKQEVRHKEIADHLTTLVTLIDRSDEFDHLTRYLSERLKVSIEELTGVGLHSSSR